MSDSCEGLWQAFLGSGSQAAASALGATYTCWQFGYGKEQGDRLLAYVIDGPKRATAGALATYQDAGEAVPVVGDYSIVKDGSGVGRVVIRTTSVEVIPFDQVSAEFAYREGEGDRSLDYWRRVHWEYFTKELAEFGQESSSDMPVVCESFEVVYPPISEPHAGLGSQ